MHNLTCVVGHGVDVVKKLKKSGNPSTAQADTHVFSNLCQQILSTISAYT